jgi:site-specific recombinase XerD
VTLPWRDVDGEPLSVDLILTTRERKAVNRNYWNGAVWKQALEAAGIEPSRENGMHALRHHYASVLLEDGVSIKAVSDYLGHADPAFTLRTYTHLLPSSGDRAREAVEAAFAARRSGMAMESKATRLQ